MTTLPLSHISVLDLTAHRAGPTACASSPTGARTSSRSSRPAGRKGDAIGGNRHGADFQNLHRNKRAMTLNLKSEEGRAIFMKLAENADVVVENYRSDVKHRLKVDYDTVAKVNPRIVYGSISGFGQDGPDATRPGVDQIAQGMGGLMSITGVPGRGPVRVGIPIADLTAGIFLSQGILLALYKRERTGKGQWVHTSLLEAQIFMLDFQAARWLMKGEVAKQAGNDHPTGIPTGVFPTADGHINIAASGEKLWKRCGAAWARPSWSTIPSMRRGALRSQNRKARERADRRRSPRRSRAAYWVKLLNKAGVPCGPINTIDQTFEEPQVQHLGIARAVHHPELGDIKVVGQPIKLTDAPQPKELRADAGPRRSIPTRSWRASGYDSKAIDALEGRRRHLMATARKGR